MYKKQSFTMYKNIRLFHSTSRNQLGCTVMVWWSRVFPRERRAGSTQLSMIFVAKYVVAQESRLGQIENFLPTYVKDLYHAQKVCNPSKNARKRKPYSFVYCSINLFLPFVSCDRNVFKKNTAHIIIFEGWKLKE